MQLWVLFMNLFTNLSLVTIVLNIIIENAVKKQIFRSK